MSDETHDEVPCPKCNSPYPYPMGELMVCPECAYEWNPSAAPTTEAQGASEQGEEGELVVRDANGNLLANGDSVSIIKSLPVKGAPKPIKIGTKVTNIMLVDGDHNISCKVPGFGAMMLKSEFVKKA